MAISGHSLGVSSKELECQVIDPKNDVFDAKNTIFTTSRKVEEVAWTIFCIIIFPIGLISLLMDYLMGQSVQGALLPSLSIKEEDFDSYSDITEYMREKVRTSLDFVEKEESSEITRFIRAEEAQIQTVDGVKLFGVKVFHPAQREVRLKDQKWVIHLSGNFEIFQRGKEAFSDGLTIAMRNGANFMHFNYRGTGGSEGLPKSAQDLYFDVAAMVQSLLDQGVKPENIMVEGLSMGGALGTVVVSEYHKKGIGIKFMNNRSFSTVGSFIDYYANRMHCLIKCIAPIAKCLLSSHDWWIDPQSRLEMLKKDRVLVISHELDEVIPHPEVGLYSRAKEMGYDTVLLKKALEYVSHHCVPILYLESEGKQCLERAADLLNKA